MVKKGASPGGRVAACGETGSTVPIRGRLTASAPTGCSTLGRAQEHDDRGAPEDRGDESTSRRTSGRHAEIVARPGGHPVEPGPERPGQDSTAAGPSAGSASLGGMPGAGLGVHRRLLGDVVDVLLGLLVELLALVLVHVEVLALLALHARVLPPAPPGNRGPREDFRAGGDEFRAPAPSTRHDSIHHRSPDHRQRHRRGHVHRRRPGRRPRLLHREARFRGARRLAVRRARRAPLAGGRPSRLAGPPRAQPADGRRSSPAGAGSAWRRRTSWPSTSG